MRFGTGSGVKLHLMEPVHYAKGAGSELVPTSLIPSSIKFDVSNPPLRGPEGTI